MRTPSLDGLAARSTVFTNATVANPTCMPNRASLMTGRWPSAHGTRCNGITMDPQARTVPRALAGEGYRTIGVGKLLRQNMGWEFEPHQKVEIDAALPLMLNPAIGNAREPGYPAGWDQWECRTAHEARFIGLPADYYGYDHVDLVIGHGDCPGGHYVHWAREHGVDPSAVGGVEHSGLAYAQWDQVVPERHPGTAAPHQLVQRKSPWAPQGCGRPGPAILRVYLLPGPAPSVFAARRILGPV